MAERPSQTPPIGVGSALRKARAHRELTLEGAARDTKLRTEQLEALEREDFEMLGGEVYVRATLRTYAAYLGLDPDKVMRVYARHADDPEPPAPPGKMGRVERAIAATRIRDNQRFLLIAAAFVFVVLIVFGLLSRDHSAPPPAAIATQTATAAPADQAFGVTLSASGVVKVTVIIDGDPASFTMVKGEERSFTATSELSVDAGDGGAVQVVVQGRDLGVPGEPGQPWSRTFTYAEVSAWPSPSASETPSGSVSSAASPSA
jgi:cytoskeleton protein RodZ